MEMMRTMDVMQQTVKAHPSTCDTSTGTETDPKSFTEAKACIYVM
jgi:hypothetical protein